MSEVFEVTADPRFRVYTASAAQVAFSVSFPFQDNADITIVKIDLDGVETTLTEITHYTLTGAGDDAGGTATLVTGAAAGEQIVVVGDAVMDRVLSVVRAGRFKSAAIDADLDRALIRDQELARDIGRSVKSKYGQAGLSIDLAAFTTGQTLMLGDDNTLVPGPDATDIAGAQGYASAAAASAAAAGTSASNASDSAAAAAASAASVEIRRAANKTALKAIATAACTVAFLAGEGLFDLTAGDWAALVAADTAEGIVIKADDTPAATAAWVRRDGWAISGVNPVWFGGSVSKTTLQLAHDFLAVYGGGIIRSPVGIHLIDTTSGPINVSAGVVFEGCGTGPNIAGVSAGTVFRNSANANHMFSVTSASPVAFRNIGFDIQGSVTKTAGTAAISINETTSGSATMKVIEHCRFRGFSDAVQIINAHFPRIINNDFIDFHRFGIYYTQTNFTDRPSGQIDGNKFWDVAGTAGATAAIRLDRGNGLQITNNRLLGAGVYGIQITFSATDEHTGQLLIQGNLIDAEVNYGIYLSQSGPSATAGMKYGWVNIANNNITGTQTGYVSAIRVVSNGVSSWLNGVSVTGNMIRNNQSTSPMIHIQSGDTVQVANNLIRSDGSGTSSIKVDTDVVSGRVHENVITGAATAPYVVNASTVVVDHATPILFANIPSSIANGSMIFVSNGAPASAPLTGASTGTLAKRLNGAWAG